MFIDFTDFFEAYYIPKETAMKDMGNAIDMAKILGSRKKFEKLMEYCHVGSIEFPQKFEGLVNIMDAAVILQIKPLKEACELEILDRLDITNFVQIVELVFGENLNQELANPVIWNFMIQWVSFIKKIT